MIVNNVVYVLLILQTEDYRLSMINVQSFSLSTDLTSSRSVYYSELFVRFIVNNNFLGSFNQC